MKKLTKAISLLVCICFIFSFCLNSIVSAASDKDFDKSSIKTIQNDEKLCTVMASYEGDELYATLDKETDEITMQSVEKPKAKVFGLSVGETKKKTFKVKVDKALDDGEVSAVIIDDETNKEYKVSQKASKVIAQIPLAIPLLEILGAALIEALLIAATAVVIGGATYYVASKVVEKLREKNYDYYLATITSGKVYIGPSVNYATAFATVEVGSDIFSRTQSLALSLAKAAGGGFARGPENDNPSSPNYFWHYHPKYGTPASYYAHCFY